jgi:hypothetical protein
MTKKVSLILMSVIILIGITGGLYIRLRIQNPPEPICHSIYDGEVSIEEVNGDLSVLDSEGNLVITTGYDEIQSINDTMYEVVYRDKHGVIDNECNIVIDIENEDVVESYIGNQKVMISINDIYSIYDNMGDLFINETFDEIDFKLLSSIKTLVMNTDVEIDESNIYFSLIVNKDGKYGVLDQEGNLTLPIIYDDIETHYISSETLRVKLDDLWGIATRNNEMLLPIQYSSIRDEVIVTNNSKFGIIDLNGEIVVEPIYENISKKYVSEFLEYWHYVTLDDKIGMLNSEYKITIPINYDVVVVYKSILIVSENGKYGVIDFSLNTLIDFTYSEIFSVNTSPLNPNEFTLSVEKNGKKGVIDLEENIILPIEYDNFELFDNVIIVEQDGLKAVIDYDFNVLLDFIYTDVQYLTDDSFLVELDNRNYITITLEPDN